MKDRSIVWLISTILGKPVSMEKWLAPLDWCRGANGLVRALCFNSEAEAQKWLDQNRM